jgi:predicted phosphodiesterase
MKKYFYCLSLLFFLFCPSLYGDTPGNFRFIILGDRTGGRIDHIYEKIIEKSLNEHADFYITVGDQIDGDTYKSSLIHEQWDEYFSIVSPIPVELYLVPGNHDIWSDLSREIWCDRTGRSPNYSFSYRGVHFTVLDVSQWESSETLSETSITWLKEDLSKHKDALFTFVFFHKPFWYLSLRMGKEDKLHEIFKAYGVDAVFTGHLHFFFSAEYDEISYTIIGSSGGSLKGLYDNFFHYALVEVTENSFSVTVKPF